MPDMLNPADRQLGRTIGRLRRAACLSLPHLASMMEVGDLQLATVEAGEARLRSHQIEKAAAALGVPLHVLYDGAGERAGAFGLQGAN